MKSPIAAFTAFIAGGIVLAGYFTDSALIQSIRTPLLDWTVILAGVAGLIAIANLVFAVHMRRIREKVPNQAYSYVLILSFVIVFIVGMLAGPRSPRVQKVVTNIQMPVEASLMAVLAITLVVASLRFLQRQAQLMGSHLFVATLFFWCSTVASFHFLLIFLCCGWLFQPPTSFRWVGRGVSCWG